MKKNTTIFLLSLLSLVPLMAQTDKLASKDRVIEVTGTAEPNEFTFKITLYERFENREKVTIEKQETKLKEELTNIGIDVANDLTIADINSIFTYRRRKKDVMGSKDYQLKVYDLTKVEKLQQLADKLDLEKLDLVNATHTNLIKFRKETKMEAVKSAKLKAEYMLEAIGEQIGKPILIEEIIDSDDYQNFESKLKKGELSGNSMIFMQDNLKSGETLSFSKIKLRYSVLARFEIK